MSNINSNERKIKISPRYCKEDWYKWVSQENSKDWDTAIDIFKDRMEGRYFKQIEVLDKNPCRKVGMFAGFTIMSIICLLIETLEQFRNGHKSTRGKHSLAFFNFFQRSDKFKDFFDTEEKAGVFYDTIRCGLLHQGETKKKSLIHIRDEVMLAWIDEENPKIGLSIQRQLFVKEVKKIYNKYIEDLKNPLNAELKNKFKTKMKDIVSSQS
ncbi:MAG: hypothetical protein LBQ28_00600 [Prevotellaceae bacterium]|jgi:hypothetical protein|nr:hypothetical protein [Prevotellaceae bacterium]